ncbi:MAG: efflux RND transporter periplasmic adaptor subunit, partial [Muribaculum sp.]|nr:efflux RND transporter periplasmic adaptor subunit [Muribaculum sp.]
MDRQVPREQLAKERRKKWIKATLIIGTIVAVFITVLFSIEKSIKREYIILGGARIGSLETSVTAGGTVKPAYEQIVTSPISSTIIEVYHSEGDIVEAGTPLLKLDLQTTE